MAKKIPEVVCEWYVPAKITICVDAYVTAIDADEASAKVKAGDFDYEHNQGEMVDWEATGEPVKNQ